MAGPNLPLTGITIGRGIDQHIADHQAIDQIVNAFDVSVSSASAGQVLVYNGATYAPVSAVVKVQAFGAKGDNSTDDTSSINAAMASGLSLDFGGPDRTYRVTASLSYTLSRHTYWVGSGATIKLDSASNIERTVNIVQNGYDFRIAGVNIDANSKGYVCLYASNSGTNAKLVVDKVVAQNAFRAATTFVRGDGIYVAGGYDQITINDTHVKNVQMATGAGIAGSQGVTGITVDALSQTVTWRKVAINGCTIENVYSQDTTYQADQDGIRIMSASDDTTTPILYPWDSHFTISNTTFINCQGRAVKSQTEFCSVINPVIIRNRNVSAAWGVDIDFQVGGGYVENLYCKYTDNAPTTVVNFSGSVTANKVVPHGSVKGLRVNQSGIYSPNAVVQTTPRSQLQTTNFVDDVEYLGAQAPSFMLRVTGISAGVHNLYAHRVVGSASGGGFIQASGVTGTVQTGKFFLSEMVNTGSATNLVTTPNSQFLPEVSTVGSTGFTNTWKALDGGRSTLTDALRVRMIGPVSTVDGDGSKASGVLRPYSVTLAAAATQQLPASFLTSFTGMLIISVDGDINGQALFAVNTTTVTQLTTATTFAVGTTTDPGTASKVTVWTGASGPSIGNHTAASHTITVLMFG
jgi:hypothetical protein